MNYLITNASVVNEGRIFEADVLVEDGLIGGIAPTSNVPNAINLGPVIKELWGE